MRVKQKSGIPVKVELPTYGNSVGSLWTRPRGPRRRAASLSRVFGDGATRHARALAALTLVALIAGGCGGSDGGEAGELGDGERAAVRAAAESYIASLNAGDGAAVCSKLARGAPASPPP